MVDATTKPAPVLTQEGREQKRAEEALAASERLNIAAVLYAETKREVLASDAGGLDPEAVAGWRRALLELDVACRAFAKFNRMIGER